MNAVARKKSSRKNLRIQLGERSRRRIQKAALELLSEFGYARASISAIAKRSGLPASSLYWHFGSKRGLLTAVAEQSSQKWRKVIPDWAELKGSPLERLSEMSRLMAASIVREPEHVRLVLMLYLASNGGDFVSKAGIRRLREGALAKFRPAAEALLDYFGAPKSSEKIEELSKSALIYCNGCAINYQIDGSNAELAKNMSRLRVAMAAIAREFAPAPD